MRVQSAVVFLLALATSLPAQAQPMFASYYAAPKPDVVAHRTLPFGTLLGLSRGARHFCCAVVCDRGPAAWTGKDIDVSEHIAQTLGFYGSQGVAWLEVDVLGHGRCR